MPRPGCGTVIEVRGRISKEVERVRAERPLEVDVRCRARSRTIERGEVTSLEKSPNLIASATSFHPLEESYQKRQPQVLFEKTGSCSGLMLFSFFHRFALVRGATHGVAVGGAVHGGAIHGGAIHGSAIHGGAIHGGATTATPPCSGWARSHAPQNAQRDHQSNDQDQFLHNVLLLKVGWSFKGMKGPSFSYHNSDEIV